MGTKMLALAAAALLVAGPAASDGSDRTSDAARLAIVDRSPLTIGGSGFVAAERVLVVGGAGRQTGTARVRANAIGRFVVRFPRLVVSGRCAGDLWARATGSAGSRALVRVRPQPLCPPRAP